MEFAGEFETHLTLRPDDDQRIAALRDWALAHGLKCLHIILDRGRTVSQPMLSYRGQGVLSQELDAAQTLCHQLNQEGFAVSRIKIEAAPTNEDVPRNERDAVRHPPGRYFEHHVKLELEADADLSSLLDLAQRHGAHLSRNALRVGVDGRQERFVTQRCAGVGHDEARNRLHALLQALAAEGYRVLDVEDEFVVYDSNAAVDAGWLDTGESRS